MQEFGTTGGHYHCFCQQDTGRNILCCKCGAMIMSCDSCLVKFCTQRNRFKAMSPADTPAYYFECPLAGNNYRLTYKAVVE